MAKKNNKNIMVTGSVVHRLWREGNYVIMELGTGEGGKN